MTQNAAVTQDTTSKPLDALSVLLDADMRHVNALIMENMQSHVPMIPQLASYLIAAGGKRVRPLLTLAATAMYGGDMARAAGLAACVEFIHSATLLHDDVIDESAQRRGQDAANIIFGNQASVLVGDFLFARAFALMTKDGSLEVLRILSEASVTITEGEVLQMSLAGNLETTFDQYINVVDGKTAALFAAACEVGPVIAGKSKEHQKALYDYGTMMGIAFQIADDALDYNAAQEKLGKTVGDDFREGKLTAPVLYALETANDEEHAFWSRTISKHQQEDGDLAHALSLMEKHNTITKSLELAYDYADKAKAALATCPEGEIKTHLLALADYVVKREF